MICGTFTVTKISDADVAGVVARFKATVPAPLDVSQTKQADGTWTVVATYPPCGDNVSHSASGKKTSGKKSPSKKTPSKKTPTKKTSSKKS